ncbi:Hypothetical protein FKW44_007254 [Caligus rogercresseyi]|uniref:Uncharacterized protein n=1 Tax=Caligus rogercresseyi TaxID=217165 RepID=A0A7T8QTF8_CALRO|nr:Hypothetical protein FKW44_007254 [Caligus rogercresseyi]
MKKKDVDVKKLQKSEDVKKEAAKEEAKRLREEEKRRREELRQLQKSENLKNWRQLKKQNASSCPRETVKACSLPQGWRSNSSRSP